MFLVGSICQGECETISSGGGIEISVVLLNHSSLIVTNIDGARDGLFGCEKSSINVLDGSVHPQIGIGAEVLGWHLEGELDLPDEVLVNGVDTEASSKFEETLTLVRSVEC